MIINMINSILGSPPIGYEWLTYVIGPLVLVMLIKSIYYMFSYVLKIFDMFGGGR